MWRPTDKQPNDPREVWLFLFRLLQKPSRNDKEQQYGFSVCSILACVEVVWFVAQIIS